MTRHEGMLKTDPQWVDIDQRFRMPRTPGRTQWMLSLRNRTICSRCGETREGELGDTREWFQEHRRECGS